MLRSKLTILCILLLGISARPAGAADWDDALAAPEPWPIAETGPWYGYQTLLVDAASLTVGAIALSHRGEIHADRLGSTALTLGLIASVGYLAGPPALHALHGRPMRATGSLALRVGLPAVAAIASYVLLVVALGHDCTACAYAIPVVGGAALVTPIVIDAFSHDRYSPGGFVIRF